MLIFIDFDDVLFNTKEFVADYKDAFFSHGVSPEKFEECYYDYPKKNGDGTISKYEFRGHLKRLEASCPEADIKEVEKSVVEILKNAGRYVFDDAKYFLESMRGNNDIFVVSYGDAVFQHDKIEGSGVASLVSGVVITDKMKAEAIGEMIDNRPDGRMIFIDDRLEQISNVKNRFPQIVTFLMKRPEGRWQDEFDGECCDHEVKSLREVMEILESI